MHDIVLLDPSFEVLKSTPIGRWVQVVHSDSGVSYLNIRGNHCLIALEPRPSYCNRGRFLAKLEVLEEHELCIDWADGWNPGRYYFDLDRAKAEIEAWLKARNQLEGGDDAKS